MALPFINDGGASHGMRKRDDEVFLNAAGIETGVSSHWLAVPRHLAVQAGCEPVREVGATVIVVEGDGTGRQ